MMASVLHERMQSDIWRLTLFNLAYRFGVNAKVETKIFIVDRRRQWHNAENIWQNAAIRSGLGAQLRLFRRG